MVLTPRLQVSAQSLGSLAHSSDTKLLHPRFSTIMNKHFPNKKSTLTPFIDFQSSHHNVPQTSLIAMYPCPTSHMNKSIKLLQLSESKERGINRVTFSSTKSKVSWDEQITLPLYTFKRCHTFHALPIMLRDLYLKNEGLS